MWSYLLVLVLAGLSLSASPPKKNLFDIVQDEAPIEPFIDPIDGISYRLSNETYPLHYDVSIKTDIHAADFAFTGKVEILFEVRATTLQITLQQRQLTIIKVDLFYFDGVMLQENCLFTELCLEDVKTV